MSFAFKEWAPVVQALRDGRQKLILRKGGIAEDRGKFDVVSTRFWLLPTYFHTQVEKIKPAYHNLINPPPETLQVPAYAEVASHSFVEDWQTVASFADQHILTASTIRDRFEWGQTPGIHLIWVRVFQLTQPLPIELTPAQSGCKSWIELPLEIDDYPATPVAP